MEINLRNKVLGIGVIFASIAMLIRRVWLMELDSFEFDDAFMFIRYAENVLAGHGYTWNGDEPLTYGNTSILYTYVIAINKLLFGKVLSNSWVLISSSLVFSLAFLFQLQRGLFKQVESSWLKNRIVIGLITLPFIIFPLIFGFHISTGMETTLSLFLNGLFIFAALNYSKNEEAQVKSVLGLAFIGYFLFLTRPDNALVVALFPVLLCLTNKKYKHVWMFIITMGIIIGLDTLTKYLLFGEFLPLSFYAKKSGFTEGYTAKYFWNPIKYITQFTAYMMPFILMGLLFLRKKTSALLLAFTLPLIVTFTYYFTFDQIMGFNARLYFPFIPYIIVASILLMDKALIDWNPKVESLFKFNNLLSKLIVLILFLVVTVFSKYRFINQYETYAINAGNKDAILIENLDVRKYNRESSIRIISAWLKEFPSDFVFGATEHGYISGDNPDKKIVDFSGLHNVYIAKNGYDESVISSTKPDFIWMPHQDLTVLHYKIRVGEYFQENYEYIPSYFAFGCAIRKDSKYYDDLISKFEY